MRFGVFPRGERFLADLLYYFRSVSFPKSFHCWAGPHDGLRLDAGLCTGLMESEISEITLQPPATRIRDTGLRCAASRSQLSSDHAIGSEALRGPQHFPTSLRRFGVCMCDASQLSRNPRWGSQQLRLSCPYLPPQANEP